MKIPIAKVRGDNNNIRLQPEAAEAAGNNVLPSSTNISEPPRQLEEEEATASASTRKRRNHVEASEIESKDAGQTFSSELNGLDMQRLNRAELYLNQFEELFQKV